MTQQNQPAIEWNIIQTQVGDRQRLVDIDLFNAVHQRLADEGRARGLTGHALDIAIVSNLSRRLATILDGITYH